MESGLDRARRRDATQVIYDLLYLARDKVTKTQMVYRANLNFHVVDGYIDFLLGKTFITRSDDGQRWPMYELTERGQRLLALLEELYSPSLLSYVKDKSGMFGCSRRIPQSPL